MAEKEVFGGWVHVGKGTRLADGQITLACGCRIQLRAATAPIPGLQTVWLRSCGAHHGSAVKGGSIVPSQVFDQTLESSTPQVHEEGSNIGFFNRNKKL